MAFVIDASTVLAGLFADEATPQAYVMVADMTHDPVAAPLIWRFEVTNGLRVAERKGRMASAAVAAALDELDLQPIVVDREMLDMRSLLPLSRRHDLTVYDASYLELALRLGRPLATLDARLACAARAEGVPVFA